MAFVTSKQKTELTGAILADTSRACCLHIFPSTPAMPVVTAQSCASITCTFTFLPAWLCDACGGCFGGEDPGRCHSPLKPPLLSCFWTRCFTSQTTTGHLSSGVRTERSHKIRATQAAKGKTISLCNCLHRERHRMASFPDDKAHALAICLSRGKGTLSLTALSASFRAISARKDRSEALEAHPADLVCVLVHLHAWEIQCLGLVCCSAKKRPTALPDTRARREWNQQAYGRVSLDSSAWFAWFGMLCVVGG